MKTETTDHEVETARLLALREDISRNILRVQVKMYALSAELRDLQEREQKVIVACVNHQFSK